MDKQACIRAAWHHVEEHYGKLGPWLGLDPEHSLVQGLLHVETAYFERADSSPSRIPVPLSPPAISVRLLK